MQSTTCRFSRHLLIKKAYMSFWLPVLTPDDTFDEEAVRVVVLAEMENKK
jgi:hypothetical protein